MPRIPNVTSTHLYFLDNCLFHFLNSFSLVRVFLFVSFIWGNGKVRLTHYLVFKYLTTMKSWNVDLLFHVEKVVVSKEGSFFFYKFIALVPCCLFKCQRCSIVRGVMTWYKKYLPEVLGWLCSDVRCFYRVPKYCSFGSWRQQGHSSQEKQTQTYTVAFI